MENTPNITTALAKIQAWAHDFAPDVTFRPPASPMALDNFTEKSGLNLPEELRCLLLVTDGETRKSAGMIGNWRLMPINEIQAVWGLLSKLNEKGAFSGLDPKPSPYIHRSWWLDTWLPIVSSDVGDYFCLDTDPPDPNRSGQVILFLQNQPERYLIAKNLRNWFGRILRDLDSGIYEYDPVKGFNGEAFMWSALEGKHLFDDIEGTLVVDQSS